MRWALTRLLCLLPLSSSPPMLFTVFDPARAQAATRNALLALLSAVGRAAAELSSSGSSAAAHHSGTRQMQGWPTTCTCSSRRPAIKNGFLKIGKPSSPPLLKIHETATRTPPQQRNITPNNVDFDQIRLRRSST